MALTSALGPAGDDKMLAMPNDPLDLERVTAGDFEPHIGVTFSAHVGDRVVPLVLAAVRLLGPATTAVRGEGFALDLHGPAQPVLPGQMWSLTAAEVGRLDLFLSPVARRDDGGIAYEAIFN